MALSIGASCSLYSNRKLNHSNLASARLDGVVSSKKNVSRAQRPPHLSICWLNCLHYPSLFQRCTEAGNYILPSDHLSHCQPLLCMLVLIQTCSSSTTRQFVSDKNTSGAVNTLCQ